MDLTLTDWLENSGSWRSACTTMAFWLYCYFEMLELITKPQHLLVEKRGRHPEVEWCSFFWGADSCRVGSCTLPFGEEKLWPQVGILLSYVVLRWWFFKLFENTFLGFLASKIGGSFYKTWCWNSHRPLRLDSSRGDLSKMADLGSFRRFPWIWWWQSLSQFMWK